MGTLFSKQDTSVERIEYKSDGTPVKVKTSPYGWGQLSHPVKPLAQQPKNKKKRTKWVDPTVTTNVSPPLLSPTTSTITTTVSPNLTPVGQGRQQDSNNSKQNGSAFLAISPAHRPTGTSGTGSTLNDKTAATRSNPSFPIVSLRPRSNASNRLNRKSVPNSSQVKMATAAGRGILPKYTFKSTLKEEASTTSVTDTKTVVKTKLPPSTNAPGTGKSYYGQYRCVKCKRYWRSALSRDGVSQMCSKCRIPVFPRE